MDLSTVGGVLASLLLLVSALWIASGHEGAGFSLGQFVDYPAALLVFGGGLAVVLTSVPLRVFARLPAICLKLLMTRRTDQQAISAQLVSLAEEARRNGVLALEQRLGDHDNPTLRQAVQLAVDGTTPEVITRIIRTGIKAIEAQAHVERRMFELMGRCGPAFGMIATLLGLIQMLGNLEDPDTIGPSMALALVGTLYGAAVANMICMPCAEKLGYLAEEEARARELILDGVLAIQAGDGPRIVAEKLAAHQPQEPDYVQAA